MELLVTTEFKTRPLSHILEDALNALGEPVVRKWKIVGVNKFHSNAFDIQWGSTIRILFPADFESYYVN